MTQSTTYTDSTTFTVTHARHLAAKVATDLKRIQRFYGSPSDSDIDAYEQEVVELLRGGYLDTVQLGFKRGDVWIEPMLQYSARELATASAADDDPGRIRPGADIKGAVFHSYLTRTLRWWALSESEREAVQRSLPFRRVTGSQPGVSGQLTSDRVYSAGGCSLGRSSLRGLP